MDGFKIKSGFAGRSFFGATRSRIKVDVFACGEK
jgi:hypothetical protein